MRPAEQNVTFTLYKLECKKTEDPGGDEPYMWILGFKVDADTLGPPPAGSLLPTLGVQVFEGGPAFPWLLGPNSLDAPATIPIPATLGTRSFRLKPALLPLGGWFPGLAGMVCLLWDEDAFSPSTSEAGHKVFNRVFGPALSTELTKLINGGYDDPLSRDANNNVVPIPDSGQDLNWRLARLNDPAGRANAVKAITNTVKDNIKDKLRDALSDAASWVEKLDPDDLLGVAAQVYMGDELRTRQSFSLTFTDEDADYTARGHAFGSAIHVARIAATVTEVERRLDRWVELSLRVCWFPPQNYSAFAFRLKTNTRFELRSVLGEPPTSVRWFLDDVPLANGEGSLTVHFEPTDLYTGPPQDVLASHYPGGSGTLKYRSDGPILDIWNEGGDGLFFGKVRVLYAFAGDPSLFPAPTTPVSELFRLGYDQSWNLSVLAVELDMDNDYNDDVGRCKRIADEIDRKHIAVNFGKVKINPGDPPPFRQELLDRVSVEGRLANASGLEILTRPRLLR